MRNMDQWAGFSLCCSMEMIKESHTRSMAREFSGGRLALVEGGHWIAGENPRQYNREVEKFLKEYGTPRQAAF